MRTPSVQKFDMRHALFVAFAFGSFFDLAASVLGMAVIFQADSMFGYAASFAFAFVTVCLGFCMEALVAQRRKRLYICLFVGACCALLLDFYAVLNAMVAHVIQKNPLTLTSPISWGSVWQSTPGTVCAVLVAVILFIVSSPIMVSFLMPEIWPKTQDTGNAGQTQSNRRKETVDATAAG